MLVKPPFSVLLCCFLLLASFLFIPYGVVARRLLQAHENDNGRSRTVGIPSHTKHDSSRVVQNPPPSSQSRGKVSQSKAIFSPSWVGQNPPPSSPRNGRKYAVYEAFNRDKAISVPERSSTANVTRCSSDLYSRACHRYFN